MPFVHFNVLRDPFEIESNNSLNAERAKTGGRAKIGGKGGHKRCVLGERQLTIRAYVVERA